MNKELFERLLYEGEGTTLDFKKSQYLFVRASEDEKSELLKDILGFANAWRRSKAYIIIGVQEIPGGRSKVVGISASDHLNDHALQQFVNNLTNQPIRFQYETFGFEGKRVGIIGIDEQIRPIYLKRDYGKLLKEKVYVRRGSSTDPTKPATLEEIAQMRIDSGEIPAELLIEFCHVDRDKALGTSLSWSAEYCEMPEKRMIPDLTESRQQDPFGFDNLVYPSLDLNSNFFRELAEFEFVSRLFKPFRLVVQNAGQVAANNVRAELIIPANCGTLILEAADVPPPPKRRSNFFRNPIFKDIQPTRQSESGGVIINKNSEKFRVEIDCGDLQPGRQVWSDVLYIGKSESGDLSLGGFIFAENLPKPKDFTLTISATVKTTSMTVLELCELREPKTQKR